MVKKLMKDALDLFKGNNKDLSNQTTQIDYTLNGTKSVERIYIPGNVVVYGKGLAYEHREMEKLESSFLNLRPRYFIDVNPNSGFIGYGGTGVVFHGKIDIPDFNLKRLELHPVQYQNLLNLYSAYKKENGEYENTFAIKILRPDVVESLDPTGKKNLIRNFNNEAHTLDKLSHVLPDCITKIYDYGQLEGNDKNYHYMALEEMSPYTLEKIITGVSPEEVGQMTSETDSSSKYEFSINSKWQLVEMICNKLAKIHNLYNDPENKIAHRDIKPQNILCSKGTKIKLYKDGWRFQRGLDIKFGDLGLVKWLGFNANEENEILGTYDYMSYEQLTNPSEVDYKTDIFSMGLVLYQLINGVNPRYSMDYMRMARLDFLEGEIDKSEYESVLKSHKIKINTNPDDKRFKLFNEMIFNMIRMNPEERISMNDVCAMIPEIVKQYNTEKGLNILSRLPILTL